MIRAGVLAMLAIASSASAAAPDWQQAEPISIVLSNFKFAPDQLHLSKGHAYRLHFVNEGSGGHNFSAPEFFAAAQIDPEDAGKLSKGTVELDKGEAKDIRLVPIAGAYAVKCTHFLHASFGMKGSIAVN